jgi:ATP-dependent DNA helicase RecG
VTDADLAEIIGALPFTLTGDQSAAVEAIAEDLASERPMRRLLQGDVGSGKTAVAAVALASAVRAGWQGALMAPTEIPRASTMPGSRHCSTAGGPVRVPLRIPHPKRSARSTTRSPGGMAEVVIGTHAVISAAVEFPRLGLAIVDEQHRFGVGQRAALQAKGAGGEPHTLALTATPIPRTLALTVYGDLSISTIREMPPGRQPIRTEIRDRRAMSKIDEFLAAEAAEGRQSFVVAPLVVESETLGRRAPRRRRSGSGSALPGVRVGCPCNSAPTCATRRWRRSRQVTCSSPRRSSGRIDVPNAR